MGTQSSLPFQFDCTTCGNSEKDFLVWFIGSLQSKDWKKNLKCQCEVIKHQCKWAKYLLKYSMNKIKQEPNQTYITQFLAANQQYKSLFMKNQRRSQSYSNKIIGSIKQSTELSIKQLIKNSDFTISQLETSTNKHIPTEQISISLQVIEKRNCKKDDLDENIIIYQITYYLEIIKLLKQQISNEDHQLNFVLHCFIDSFKKQYNIERSRHQLQNAIDDIKQFTTIYYQCIENYYEKEQLQLSIGKITELFNKENITTTIISALFSKEIIYEIIYDMLLEYFQDIRALINFVGCAAFQSQYNKCISIESTESIIIQQSYIKSNQDNFRDALEHLYNQDMQQFDINIKYRLDQSTHSYLFKKYSNCSSNFRDSPPYHKCIKLLKILKEKQSPQQKYKALINCLEKITKQIKHFYTIHSCPFDMQIESADLILIDMYIIIKSQIFDLPVHLYMIEQFVINNDSYGSHGYHFTSFKAAIKMILQIQN